MEAPRPSFVLEERCKDREASLAFSPSRLGAGAEATDLEVFSNAPGTPQPTTCGEESWWSDLVSRSPFPLVERD